MSTKPKKDALAFVNALRGGATDDEAELPVRPKAAASPVTAAPEAPLPEPEAASAQAAVHWLPAPAAAKKASGKKSKQAELKHFGGYIPDEIDEKIALLKIRLKKDNSALLTHMVNEEYARLNAKRAFGDA